MSHKNLLYYGDNLDVLRQHIKDESVDLIYLDPPFNSNQDYNILFAEKDGTEATAQIKAFKDTWHWDRSAAAEYFEVVERGGKISQTLQAFRLLLGDNDMLAYLVMMAPRLIELRRVLKPTGSIYLHCDPTAGHYLKILMDAVFGGEFFRTEIIWRRTNAKGLAFTNFPHNHDIILYYSCSEKYIWNRPYKPHSPDYINKFYNYTDPDGRRYTLGDLVNPNPNRPNLTYEILGVSRVWRWTKARMEQAHRDGLIVQTKPGAVPRLKRYLDEQEGIAIDSIWDDIPPIQSQSKERLGYPTQKPEALLTRILEASSDKKSIVLDPFCGCGTTVAVAQRLKRKWIGIDITHLAITLIKHRLTDTFGKKAIPKIIGEPVDLTGAEELARSDPYQFQWWALGLVGARPVEQKKGADRGIDGRIYFHDDAQSGKTRQIIISVKAGRPGVAHVRDLRGTLEREQAQLGALLSFREPTAEMKRKAASAGFYQSPWGKHPRVQILTVEELLAGKGLDYPRVASATFKKARKHIQHDESMQDDMIED